MTREISYSDVTKGLGDEARVIPLEELEKRAIEMALLKYQGNISIAAKMLKLGQATLYRKVKRYGLKQ